MHYANIPRLREEGGYLRGFLSVKFLFVIILAIVMVGGFWVYLNRKSNPTAQFIYNNLPLTRSESGRMNILLLGNAGGRHGGADLTDTVIVASIDAESSRINLISIPRDLWIDDIKGKVNAVYEIGKAKGDGIGFTKQTIGNILGIPIHYALRIDFNGFVEALDELGGIDIEIENSFEDFLYPIADKEEDLCGNTEEERNFTAEEAKKLNIEPGIRKVLIDTKGNIATDSAKEDEGYKYFKCRYEHLEFTAGTVHMDGTTALKYVRSRHGTNGEGSDFARARRQQRVLEVVRKKILSLDTIMNTTKIKNVLTSLDKSVETDIPVTEIINIYSISKESNNINSYVLGGRGGDTLLVHPVSGDYGGSWVLVPKNNDFTIVQNYIKDIINGEVVTNKNEPNAKTKESSSSARSGERSL